MKLLTPYGWHPFFEATFSQWQTEGLIPARVLAEHQHLYRVITPTGEVLAKVSGRFMHQSQNREDYPAVGDWLALYWQENMDQARIEAILPRRSAFTRQSAGTKTEAQVIAANVDILLLVTSANADFNPRRLERYLTLAWESGAKPVIVLNKADLNHNLDEIRHELDRIALGVDTFIVSAQSGQGLDELKTIVKPGITLALVGSSGVGKSTLINALGSTAHTNQITQAIREDDAKGRHTTTHRELFLLPEGGLLLDTPGMRELKIWLSDEGLDHSFADIQDFAQNCRFRNCSHTQEQGCAVLEAIDQRELSLKRLQNYQKLQREEEWLERRTDPELQANAKKRWKQRSKVIRKNQKAH